MDHFDKKLDIGALVLPGRQVQFRLWAPAVNEVWVHILDGQARGFHPLQPEGRGYFSATVRGCAPGDRYLYRLNDDVERPDPASRYQPEGVHGPSQVVDPGQFVWSDSEWQGLVLEDCILYELHVGTFSPRGTFDGVAERLDELLELGVTAIELMPVAQFPGERNWGYDGTHPFAVQKSYGGPDELRALVDSCHRRGLAVVLDVVYNHLGPEGNYLRSFGPYFTDRYRTPWGEAFNFDGPQSDAVRHYIIRNALYWIDEFHLDALRLDAVHGIYDFSARHILEELTDAVHALGREQGRKVQVIAESDLNDSRLIRPRHQGGYGLDGQWNDDFHHALHAVVTGERDGYYVDFGEPSQLATSFREGFVYSGQYSLYRRRRHGNSCADLPSGQLTVFSQNHDQVGNRMLGDRLGALTSFETLKLAAAAVLLSANLPLLFMGEEYGETAPFLYFIHHGDPELVEAVRRGRAEEFSAFGWHQAPPDPQAEETFLTSRLNPALKRQFPHDRLYAFYRELIRLRKTLPALSPRAGIEMVDADSPQVLAFFRGSAKEQLLCLFNLSDRSRSCRLQIPDRGWHKRLDSASRRWNGPAESTPEELPPCAEGPTVTLLPWSCALYEQQPAS